MLINLKKISLLLTYILPIALVSGPAIPDLVIVSISILFLCNSFIERDFYWLNLNIVKKSSMMMILTFWEKNYA